MANKGLKIRALMTLPLSLIGSAIGLIVRGLQTLLKGILMLCYIIMPEAKQK